MHIFLAAVYTNQYCRGQRHYTQLTEGEQEKFHDLPNVLESWHYVHKQRFVDEMRADNAKIFLDSGAFSAHTLGVELKVSEYVDYIQRNMDIIRVEDGVAMASVLDGIGDPLQTYRNQLEMEARGFSPLPCFHSNEDTRYLDYYVKNYEYITLGGLVGASTQQLITWLDRMWEHHLVDGSGNAKIKVHGFGITSIPIMERYPWFSCDSSSWIQTTSFGGIMMPYNYDGESYHGITPMSVSEKSPSRHEPGQHATTLSLEEQDAIFRMLEMQGFTYERLSKEYVSRAAYNIWAYGVLNTMVNAMKNHDRFTEKTQDLFKGLVYA